MSDEDTRILNMQINNKQFLKGTGDSLKALDSLNKGIDASTGGKGLQNMAGGVNTVKTKFGALQVAAVTAIGTITNKAVNAGLSLAKSLAIDPIIDGFHEYQKVLTATQTIASNTGNRSSAGIDKVGVALRKLNTYSDKTIYSFSQMADNAGRFTAAGSKLNDAVSSIKGIANAAALAGASNEQLGSAMYQTSQALGVGVIKLMDWRSLENANLGTKNMRDALLDTAHAMGEQGVAADAAIKKYGSFRDSLREGWLSAEVFNKTMKVFAGTQDIVGRYTAYSVEQLQKMGYSKEAAIRLHELSAASIESATKIKTFSQLIDVVKESIGSGWANIFQDLFGNLNEAGKLWTSVGNTVTGIIGTIFQAVDSMLIQWKKLGGFTEAWGALGNIFKAVGNLLHPFLVLLDSISPGSNSAGTALYGITHVIYLFSVAVEKATRITTTLEPAFKFVGKAVGFLLDKFKEFVAWFGQFDNLFGSVGPSLARFADSIKAAFQTLFSGDFSGFGKQIRDAFGDLGKEGAWIAESLIAGLKQGLGAGSILAGIQKLVDDMINYFKNLLGIHSPSLVFEGFGKNIVDGLTQGIGAGDNGILAAIGNLVSGLVNKFKDIDKFDIANIFSVIFSAATLALVVKFAYAMSQVTSAFSNGFKEIFGKNGLLHQANQTLQAIQNGINAKALLDRAIAIGILAVALLLLSRIPYPQLVKGLVVVGILLAELTVMMDKLSKNADTSAKGLASLVAMSAAMILMATAVLILSAAVAVFGNMDVGTLVKGVAAVAVVLAVMAGAAYLLGLAAPTMILAAGGVLILSVALAALAPVILLFSKLDWSTLFSGMLKMGAALILLAIGMAPLAALAPGLLVASAALIILSVGLTALLGVLTLYSTVEWGTIIEGSAKIGAALILLGLAALVAAPGLILLGAAAVLLGAGFLAMGLGLTLAGIGLTAIAAAGAGIFAVLFAGLESFMSLLPIIGIQFIAAMDTILHALAEKAPSIVASLVEIGNQILLGISAMAPKIGRTALDILQAFIDVVLGARKKLYDAAFDLLQGLLDAFLKRIPDLIKTGVKIIKAFIVGLGQNAKGLVDTAGKTILSFMQALDDAVVKYTQPIVEIGLSIGQHIATGVLTALLDKLPGPLKTGISKFLGIGKPDKKKVPKHARGTDNSGSGLALVGEIGPELVSLNRGSAVITNKNLVGFMQSVTKLSQALTRGAVSSKNSAGGNVKYEVSADFQGDPKKNGRDFAANIIAGLINGLQSNQTDLNQTMAAVGDSMSQSFADILGIQSPSKVFRQYADYVAQGFINGLLASTGKIQKAATAMGQAAILGISKTISDNQIKLEAVRAKADAYSAAIEVLQAKADEEGLSEKKKAKLEDEIALLQKLQEQAQATSDKQADLTDKENAAKERQAEFDAADLQGKADMRKEDAATAAADASAARELALKYKKEADLIRKFDAEKAAALDKYAQIATDRATRLANQANKYSKEAYDLAQKVKFEIDAEMAKQLQSVTALDVSNAQAAFDAYTKSLAEAQSAASKDAPQQTVEFNQYNTSPEAISPAEAYRNGKSLVSIMERKLAPSNP